MRNPVQELNRQGSIFWASFWMLILSLLLFWLPGLGSLIAGIVGGKMAGSAGRAFLASILPSLIFGVLLGVFAHLLQAIPWLVALISVGGFVIAVGGAGALIIGALIGGLLA